MKITLNNFEAFLLDHLEGHLDAAQTTLLMSFLADHPELEVDLELSPVLSDAGITHHFVSPEKLKKADSAVAATSSFNAENYESSFAAFYEGDFNAEKKAALYHFLNQNPQLKPEFEIYGKLRTEPDLSVVYPDKKSLKHHRVIPIYYIRWLAPGAVAAVIALFLLFNTNPANDSFSPIQSPLVAIADQPATSDSKQPITVAHQQSVPSQVVRKTGVLSRSEMNAQPVKRSHEVIALLKPLKVNKIEVADNQPYKLDEGSRYYTSLYTDIRLRDQIRFQEEIDAQANQTIYGDAKAIADKHKFDLWALARLGVKGFNFLTNSDVDFVKARNEKGEVTDYAIGGDAIRIAHSSN
ncbi:MAG: hypothetical protein CVU06_03295 [Bacteroidetes bacterium HGW-Bacteroidetes-22]|nr:MAG: hypothetical protein CVU06_03295 [Bacteroidetes bacterium HGW-Bacteroidetes-22]